jgi:hypothetical protein
MVAGGRHHHHAGFTVRAARRIEGATSPVPGLRFFAAPEFMSANTESERLGKRSVEQRNMLDQAALSFSAKPVAAAAAVESV